MMLGVSDTNDALLGLFRMDDATVFSIDVAVAKSRNVAWFSNPAVNPLDIMDCPGLTDCRGPAFPAGTAVTNRTISFSAQPYFPSGINDTIPGPFRRVFIDDSANVCTNGQEPANGRQNGIVFFPGSVPLYQSATSGSASAATASSGTTWSPSAAGSTPKFEPPPRSRRSVFRARVRLPYL